MPLVNKPPKNFARPRRETRIPIEVGVDISGHVLLPGTENTFTENVSSRGARVLTTRRWKINDRLVLTAMAGSFRSVARVAYCQPVDAGYAVGLELEEFKKNWFVALGPAN
jgi:hypothetical protein